MQLELKDEKGTVGTIDVPLEEIKEALGLGSASGANPADASLQEKATSLGAQLKESTEKIATLETRTMDSYSPQEKASFVIAWARALPPEDKAIFAQGVGLTSAVAAEPEAKVKEGAEPMIIQGKTDKAGYKYYEHLGYSVKQSEV